VEIQRLDLREEMAMPRLASAVSEADAVLHMASSTVPGTGDRNPKLDVTDNLISLLSVMEVMSSAKVSRLIYLSSGGAVYGPSSEIPIREDHPLRPISSYGTVKAAAESFIHLFARTRELSPIILRPSNPYGERQGHEGSQGLVNTLLRRSLSGDPLEIWGDGSAVRDYLHVNDLARLIVRATESNLQGVFNVGSGTGTSIREMIDLAASITGRPLRVVYKPVRSVDPPVSVLDTRAARDSFGWNPEITLRDGLARTWAWHLAHPITK
jgi:UDP-glucose 4-epimerase